MKRNVLSWCIGMLLAVWLVVAAGCSTTRRLAEGEVLYTGVDKMEITAVDSVKIDGDVKSMVKSSLSVPPNNALFSSNSLKFKHNDMASLEKVLKSCKEDAIKLIVVDGVFSMEGDVANLPEIVALAKQYNASIYVDEAHGIGVFGRQGRGVCDHFGVTDDVDCIMGTFSKSFASLGGFVATDSVTANYLRHNSRSYIFSASIITQSTSRGNII